MDELAELRRLAGIGNGANILNNNQLTGTEKAQIMREHNIKPGTKEWFKLWFAKPHITGETAFSDK